MSKQEQEILEEEVSTEISEEEAAETTEAVQEEAALDAEKLAAELADLNQRFLRVAADFDNYKRRTV